MDSILLTSQNPINVTIVSNIFIDFYMPCAHGDYVKVYLYLLRCLNRETPFSITTLADCFGNTERDILNAIQYWEKQGLLKTDRKENGEIKEISLITPMELKQESDHKQETKAVSSTENKFFPEISRSLQTEERNPESIAVIPRPIYTAEQITYIKEMPEVANLLRNIESCVKRLLKPDDVQLVLYFYESLNFSPDLILYLYEYCISMNKTHASYIQAVALNWHRDNITTVEQAALTTTQYKKDYYSIAKALGFSNFLADAHCSYIDKWLYTWNFSLEVILEACKRTVVQIPKPSFPYVDRILEAWHKAGVCTLEDIKKEDDAFNKVSAHRAKQSLQFPKSSTQYRPSTNRFTAFEQHNYSSAEYKNMEEILLHKAEKKLLNFEKKK